MSDIRAIGEDIRDGVCPSRVKKADSTWTTWCKFCNSVGISPGLSEVDDPLFIILLFGKQYRDGRIAPSKDKVRARTAEDAMRQVGQAFSLLGMIDPRLDRTGAKLDIRITRIVSAWKRADGGAKRRRPLPVALLQAAARAARSKDASQATKAMCRLMWLGCFFLLRPGEYLCKAGSHSPFKLKQIFFRKGSQEFCADTIAHGKCRTAHVCWSTIRFAKERRAGRKNWFGGIFQIPHNPRSSTG